MMDLQAEREALHDAIQGVFAEHEDALVVGWFLITELHETDGKPYLAHRTGDMNREGLKSWQGLGFLHSAVQSVEQQSWETSSDPEEDEDV